MRSEYIKAAIQYAWLLVAWKVPYIWAGNDEYKGVDCSGMIVAIFRRVGLIPATLDLSAQGMYTKWNRYRQDNPTPGCLVFYGKDLEHISHVALMVSHKQIIEAGGGGRECTTPEIAEAKGARVRLGHYLYRDPLAFVDPFRSLVR
jgi:cell wall-associated NlpC family hydrolase